MVYITPPMYSLILQFANRLHAAVRLSAVLWCIFIFLWGQSFLTLDPDSYIAMPAGSAAALADVSRSSQRGECAPDCLLSELTQFQADFTDCRRDVFAPEPAAVPAYAEIPAPALSGIGTPPEIRPGPRLLLCSRQRAVLRC